MAKYYAQAHSAHGFILELSRTDKTMTLEAWTSTHRGHSADLEICCVRFSAVPVLHGWIHLSVQALDVLPQFNLGLALIERDAVGPPIGHRNEILLDLLPQS